MDLGRENIQKQQQESIITDIFNLLRMYSS